MAVIIDHCDDPRPVWTLDDGDDFSAAPLHHNIAGIVAETVGLVVPNDRLAALADDGAIGFVDDGASALDDFFPLFAQLFHTPYGLPRRAGWSGRSASEWHRARWLGRNDRG